MKLLFLHTDSFGGFGGIAKFNRDFITAACTCDDVEVVALPRLVEERGLAPQVPVPGLIFDDSGVGGKLRYIVAALRAAKRHGPFEKVICGHINLLPVARLCQAVAGGKLGLIIHGIDAWQPTHSRLVNRIAPKVDFYIAVSDFTRQKFCMWAGLAAERGFILPNCIDLKQFTPGPKHPELLARYGLTNRKVILTVGRMSAAERYKGFDEIIEVLSELAQEIPEVAYLVVGDGDDKPRLVQKVAELGLSDRVVFAGRISDEEKVDHYRLADVFAMPGRGEGFGIVYLEAMACGVPVIASSADASKEAVKNGALGIVVDPYNREQIKNSLSCSLAKRNETIDGLDYFSYENFSLRVKEILKKEIVYGI